MQTLEMISLLLSQQNKKQKDLCAYLGISKNVFTDWKSGRNKSYMRHLPKIADFFGVSVDYLLGKTDVIAAPVNAGYSCDIDDIDQRYIDLLTQFSKLNDTGKQKAIDNISDLTDINKYTNKDADVAHIAAWGGEMSVKPIDNKQTAEIIRLKNIIKKGQKK